MGGNLLICNYTMKCTHSTNPIKYHMSYYILIDHLFLSVNLFKLTLLQCSSARSIRKHKRFLKEIRDTFVPATLSPSLSPVIPPKYFIERSNQMPEV